ncbi:GntR family transcriptional regulator [Natronosporangium hydrolyticum]|uniref:GntR family transcriptional regulator n=1 Tax=Natronosporangium hydrolyticum TaxID=2811111 RepID=A0A895YII4_9ACTN|nr:GntR family transcriptional regulator [Natronosporangium hydrolyticum]QSB14386.1 GntR family transcriptional regulator [Natronosporangium hydrolyticum]
MFDDRSPIYQQIAERIKEDILSGALQEGDQVMSTNQYAAFYRINPATAAKGFHILVEEGIVHKRRGLGMFVSPDARQRLRTQRRERFFSDVVAPMVTQANLLGIPLSDVISHLQQQQETP